MDVNSLTIIVSILVPMFGGFFWMISRMDKMNAEIKSEIKGDVNFLRTELKVDINSIKSVIQDIHKDLRSIDSRMSRLEGGFTERGYWESRDKKIGGE